MTTHPDCLNPDACVAQGKHRTGGPARCHRCMMVARNKSEAQRAAARACSLAMGKRGKMQAASTKPEVRAKAVASTRKTTIPWCPPAYYDLNTRLTTQHVSLEERKKIIAKAERDDRRMAKHRRKLEGERLAKEAENRRLANLQDRSGLSQEAFNNLVTSLRADNILR